jgi:maleamate amidohydrolase
MAADDSALFAKQGFGRRLGIQGRLGLLVVDFVNGFADSRAFGGGNIPQAIAATRPVLAAARLAQWPVAFTRIVYAGDGSDANVFTAKVPTLLSLTEEAPASAVVEDLAPVAGEYIVRKTLPSAFFGTTAHAWLACRQVQTLVVTGCTTSGCVRASVVDAMSHGLRPIVLGDCVGDRAIAPHESSLFDMDQKYADVMQSDELFRALESGST